MTKVFYYMNHEVFLTKLHSYGTWGVYEDWFRSGLTNRRQKVEVKSPNTTKNCSLTGVHWNMDFPQGSILWLLLFIIYTNDLLLRINSISKSILFADDTSIIISSINFKDFCSVSNFSLSLSLSLSLSHD